MVPVYTWAMEKNPSLDDYMRILRQLLPELREKYHVRSLEVFGSYVRNEQSEGSDLDVLVTYSQVPTLFSLVELENYLSDTLGIKVDLVPKESLKPRLKPRILGEALPV